MVKVRVELSSLATKQLSGVGNYTRLLANALSSNSQVSSSGSYFSFFNRKPAPKVSFAKNSVHKNTFFPLKVYAKLQSFNIAMPFDFFLPKVDVTIFPNFATWPTVHSNLRATVIHDLTYLYYPELVEAKNLTHLRRVVPRSIKQADFIITVSDAVKSELIKEFKLPPERCVVTPIPPDPIYFAKNSTNIHQKYSIPTKKYLYFIGTIEPRKNIINLLRAYLSLPSEIQKEYSLVIAGGMGWKTEVIKAELNKALAKNNHIRYLGYIDQADANALQQQATLFVTASTYEGFGMPVLEAIAAKTPAVLSNIPVFREVGGDISAYFNPKDPKDIANTIQSTLQSSSFLSAFNKNRVKHLSQFSWQKNVQEIIDMCSNIKK